MPAHFRPLQEIFLLSAIWLSCNKILGSLKSSCLQELVNLVTDRVPETWGSEVP